MQYNVSKDFDMHNALSYFKVKYIKVLHFERLQSLKFTLKGCSWSTNFSDVTWNLRHLKSLTSQLLFNSLFRSTAQKHPTFEWMASCDGNPLPLDSPHKGPVIHNQWVSVKVTYIPFIITIFNAVGNCMLISGAFHIHTCIYSCHYVVTFLCKTIGIDHLVD